MKLLITGAHGLLGRALLETDWGDDVERIGCGRRPEPVGGVPCHAVDLTETDAVHELIGAERPDWVIHTAAVTDVDRCEAEPEQTRRVNVDALRHVVSACAAIGAGVAQLSTDYVFDGEAGPYLEGDPTNPLSQYGRQKLDSEAVVLGGEVAGLVVRTLWLYGYRPGARPNLVTWTLTALPRGQTMRVVGDQWGNPTYVGDLARALVELCQRRATGIYHLGGSAFMTRQEFVERVAAHFGQDAAPMEVVTTVEAGQEASRPIRSGLRSDAVQRELGWAPAELEQGLQRLSQEEGFRRDFSEILGSAGTIRS